MVAAPLVSILLPTHNRVDLLMLSIASVQQQTVADFELLVVADGCTDATANHVRALDDPRIRLFDLPKGPGFGYANRNIALREARGQFVAFAAHDDLWFPDHLEQLLGLLSSPAVEWVYSRPLWVSNDGVIVPFAVNLMLEDELEWFLTTGNTIPAGCVAYRRSCLERYGYWPEDVAHSADWRHWIAIIEGGKRERLAHLPVPTCLHFSAAWRQSRQAHSPDVAEWLQIADTESWWPPVLRTAVRPGIPEQQAIWEAMCAGEGWGTKVRAAVRVVVDRIAWDSIHVRRAAARAEIERLTGERDAWAAAFAAERSLNASLRTAMAAVEAERQVLREASKRAAHLERELDTVVHSKSWRWTAGLRRLRRLSSTAAG